MKNILLSYCHIARHIQVLDMRRIKRMARRSIGPMTDAGPSQPQVTQATMGPSSDSQGAIKKRGHTRCLEVWKIREGQHITIPINTKGQPVGDNVNKLTNFLGTVARNGEYAPLTFTDWRAVPNEKKDDMLGLVMSKFEFNADAKKWVLQSIGRKWKDWKGELKKLYYSPHETDEERLANLDERVKEDQWKTLIQFWNSKEGKARSKTSLENRKRQLIGHAAGSKSFARIREEERKKIASDEDPSRADVFILTHTCKSGKPVDEASLRVMEQLNEQISQ
ncbi:uncharacterized protein LOC131256957 [Magnolia sinica]|uniref:uncharacterized protein LOC131256957 n=1 Tax=Magnolia sinica TaxID=86752 RepID=UPI0026594AA1|nr:uncharacterized protein LOC131256957 [Magnolia sinica]